MNLSVLAIAAATIVVFVALLVLARRGRHRELHEPENSHPGKIISPGTPVAHAFRPAIEDLEELALIRKTLPPEVRRIHEGKPQLSINDSKALLRGLLDGHFNGNIFLSTLEEKTLLGALLVGNITIDPVRMGPRIANLYRSTTFRDPKHVLIFQALKAELNESKPVGISSICDRLRAYGALEYVGGEVYLKSLSELAATEEEAKQIFNRSREC